MRNGGKLATMASVLVLAAPFAAISLWLVVMIDGFGARRACMGIIHALALGWAMLILRRRLGLSGLVLATLLYLLALALTVGEAASWFMQGDSFNERFFAHVDVRNVLVSLHAYPWVAGLGVLGVLGLGLGAAYVTAGSGRRSLTWTSMVLPLLLLFIVARVDAPPHRLHRYMLKARQTLALAKSISGERIRSMLDPAPSRPADVEARPGKNLVFVYLESLERTYTDEKRFPGLTPGIDHWRHEGLDFSGFQTFPGATYTIAGIFSSQCGAPYLINSVFGSDINALGFVPGNDSTATDTFHPELACMGDVLHAAGYHQTYLSGVSLEFANTDEFFRMHHYDEAWGAPQVQKLHQEKLARAGWGLLDSDMFSEALAQFRNGVATGRPFSVVVSTIDTHPPEGYVLPGCKHYEAIRNPMLDAVHCSDQLLDAFLDKLSHEPGWENTVVIVMSDHLAMRNVASSLYPPDGQRQPLLFALNAGKGERPQRMYHMDIAPTVLDLMGVKSDVRFLSGASRAPANAPNSPLPADSIAEAVVRDALWQGRTPPTLCGGGELIRWEEQKALDIGGWSLPFMRGGWRHNDLENDRVLMVFSGRQSADLQMLQAGQQDHWLALAQKRGKSAFVAMPFWSNDGQRRLAMHWLAPNGAWASLGSVPDAPSIHLRSDRCEAMLDALGRATPGTRLDFSEAFGTEPLTAASDVSPMTIRSSELPSQMRDYGVFMRQRLTDQHVASLWLQTGSGNGFSVHSGDDHNVWLEFDVSGMSSVTLSLPRTCSVGGGSIRADISVDGQQVMPDSSLDSAKSRSLTVGVAGASRLRVDIGNGQADSKCDSFTLDFPALQMQMPGVGGKRTGLGLHSAVEAQMVVK